MSARYSHSPALRLTVGNSRLRSLLHTLLCCCAGCSLVCLYLRGYPVLALSLSPLAGWCCLSLAGQPLSGATLCWRRGEWQIVQGEASRRVRIGPRSACLPWVIYLDCRELPAGSRRPLWLFIDSAPRDQLRRLRLRLTLER